MKKNIKDAVVRYREGAIANSDFSNPKKANKGARQLHACYKILRESEEGRDALLGLMEDPEPSVRCWAAAHSLQWRPDSARRALEALRDSNGCYSATAQITLVEYDSGRLEFDY